MTNAYKAKETTSPDVKAAHASKYKDGNKDYNFRHDDDD